MVINTPNFKDYFWPGVGNIRVQDWPNDPKRAQTIMSLPTEALGVLIPFDPVEMTMEHFANEGALQAECFEWSWNYYPEFRLLFFKVHNEGKKNKRRATQDRAMGIVPGEPDIVWIQPRFGIEIKMPGEEQTKDQIKVENKWKEAGVKYYLAETLGEYKAIVISEIGYRPKKDLVIL